MKSKIKTNTKMKIRWRRVHYIEYENNNINNRKKENEKNTGKKRKE